MKKSKCLLMLFTALIVVSVFTSVYAADNAIKVTINGEVQAYDQPPVLKNGRTLVPLRGIFEALGAAVSWEEATSTVTAVKGDTTVVLAIGNADATVNGKTVKLDQAAELINSRTMVPVRFVSESLGADVSWDEKTRTVIISTESYIFKADFEDGKADAFNNTGDVSVVEMDGVGKCLKITRTSDEANSSPNDVPTFTRAEKFFDTPLTGTVAFEMKMMTDDATGLKVLMLDSGNPEEPEEPFRVLFSYKDSILKIKRPGVSPDMVAAPFELDKWHNIKIVFNTNTSTGDLYVDGNKVAENVTAAMEDKSPVRDILGFRVNIYHKNKGTIYVDDVKLYNVD